MRALIGCLLVASQLLLVRAQTPAPPSRSVDEVGDSTREASTLCGQRSTKSQVCDPDDILTEDQAAQLDAQLSTLHKDTVHPATPEGFTLGIALIKSMKIDPNIRSRLFVKPLNVDHAEHYLDMLLNEARLFSYTLLTRWNMGGSATDALIFYSANDNVVYTTTNQRIGLNLTDELVAEIWLDVRVLLTAPSDDSVFDGLKELIRQYNDVLRNQYKRSVHQYEDDQIAQEVLASATPPSQHAPLLTALAAAATLLHF